jgi:hypothetical protein
MNPLERKLIEESQKNNPEAERAIDEIKLLLSNNEAEEREILKKVGLDYDLNKIEAVKETYITKKNFKGIFNKEIVTADEIRKLCFDYRLNVLPAKRYAGRIPANLGAELVRFQKKHNLALSPNMNKFFIIAPPRMFTGYRSILQILLDTNKAIRKERLQRENDPILIYEVNEGYYAIIKSWGNDFTLLRRIYGLLLNNGLIKILPWLVIPASIWVTAPIVTIPYNLLTKYIEVNDEGAKDTLEFLGGMGGLVIIFLMVFTVPRAIIFLKRFVNKLMYHQVND